MENVSICRIYVIDKNILYLGPKNTCFSRQNKYLDSSLTQGVNFNECLQYCKLICLNIQLCLCGRDSIPYVSGIHGLWGLLGLEKEMSL